MGCPFMVSWLSLSKHIINSLFDTLCCNLNLGTSMDWTSMSDDEEGEDIFSRVDPEKYPTTAKSTTQNKQRKYQYYLRWFDGLKRTLYPTLVNECLQELLDKVRVVDDILNNSH